MERETRRERLAKEKADWEAAQLLKRESKEAKRAEKRSRRKSGEFDEPVLLDEPAVISPAVLSVSIDESSVPVKRIKRVKAGKTKTSSTYKNAVRAGLEPAVASMLDERDAVLRRWRNGVSAEDAVSELSYISTRTSDGALWKLLPRHGGVGLVKTGMDGTIEIVEPPRRRRRWPTIVTAALFGVLVALTMWGTFWPATDTSGSGSENTVTTVTLEKTTPD